MGGGLDKAKIIENTINKVDAFCREIEGGLGNGDYVGPSTVQERHFLEEMGKVLSKKEKCCDEKIGNYDRRGPGSAGCGCGMRINLEDSNGSGMMVR